MITIDFNGDWKFRRLNRREEWRDVMIPHDAMIAEPRSNKCASGTHGAWFEGFDYEYVKNFTADAELLSQRVVLEFEGVYHLAEVYVNGEKAAFRPYGFTNFYVDLSAYLRVGDNAIRVVARNADQPNCRWYAGAGIYRPVSLLILPKKCLDINGVRVRTADYSAREMAVLFCAGESGEDGIAEFSVADGDNILYSGSAKTGVESRFRIEDAQLWSVENPKLYTLRAKFGDDERSISFGVRQVTVSRAKGFTLNGERIILRGACIHGDNGILGAAAHPFADERKVRLLKAVGYNAVRSAHNPCSKATLDACDRLGMLVLDEYTDGWYIHKTRYDYASYMEEWWKRDLADMVDKDYNHPSVVMYSLGNEVSETAQKKGIELTEEMTEYLHSLDPTRSVTCGVNIFFNYLSSLGFGVYSDAKAAKGEHVGSEFFNKLAGIFGDKTMKIGATLHGCDVKTRDAFSKMDVAGYNYGILRYKKDLKKYPERIIVGTETFCKDAYAFMELARENSGIIGDFVWAGMDYLGEVGIGSWEYADYAGTFRPLSGWISAGSGRIDLTGKQLGEALYTRVAFGLDTVGMAVVPADNYKKPHSPSAWKMSNAIESWAWNGCEGKKTRVEVYSRADFAELYLNGRRVGRKRIKKDCKAFFTVTFACGTLEAVVYDESGNETGRRSLTSGRGQTRLIVQPENSRVTEGGLIYARIRFADEDGRTMPLARGRVKVRVEGGNLLGIGNACPYNSNGYIGSETDTYYGEALAVIRPISPNSVRITAESEYGSAEASVETV